jgi:AbiA family abortive infection protein
LLTAPNTMSFNSSALGNFLHYSTWCDAKNLLDFQINQKATNKHYNKLAFYHFEAARVCHEHIGEESYFNERIATNLFYALQREYYAIPYFIPKKALGIRSCYFFSYPLMTLYYAVGLYLVKLTKEVLIDLASDNIKSFYGAKLHYHEGNIIYSKQSVYYKQNYEEFKKNISEYAEITSGRYIIRLDIQNYFESICITTLLSMLEDYVKYSTKREMNFDECTKEQIEFLIRFIKHGKEGIPQSDNNLASDFIGFIYLFFGDRIIEDCIKQSSYAAKIENYKIIRYVDDIYIVLSLNSDLNLHQAETIVYYLLNSITHCLHEKLKLNVNSKTKVFRPYNPAEFLELVHEIGNVSLEAEVQMPNIPTIANLTVPEKADRLIKSLAELKNQHLNFHPEDSYRDASFDDLKDIFDRGVQNLIFNKEENRQKLSFLLNDFNYELCRLQPHALMCILMATASSAEGLLNYLKSLSGDTIYDCYLIIVYLCQINFDNKALKKILKTNKNMNTILKKFKENRGNANPCTGYYELPYEKVQWMSTQSALLEQVKLRIYNERIDNYTLSLNLLLNELQLICWLKDSSSSEIKKYDAKSVEGFLESKGLRHEVRVIVTNLFDRRNNNGISHPGNDFHMPKAVSKAEYSRYHSGVHSALNFVLQEN